MASFYAKVRNLAAAASTLVAGNEGPAFVDTAGNLLVNFSSEAVAYLKTLAGFPVDAGPGRAIRAIDLSSDTTLPAGGGVTAIPRAIYVGTGGDVKVDGVDDAGNAVTGVVFKNVPSGRELPIACITKVYSTSNGTSASDLVAIF